MKESACFLVMCHWRCVPKNEHIGHWCPLFLLVAVAYDEGPGTCVGSMATVDRQSDRFSSVLRSAAVADGFWMVSDVRVDVSLAVASWIFTV